MKFKIKRLLHFTLILLTIAGIPIEGFSQSKVSLSDRMEITSLSNEYQDAIRSSRGINVLQLVSENSIQFYENVKRLALYADEKELLEEDIHVIMETIYLRKIFDFDVLNDLDGRELIIDNYTGQSSSLNSGESLSMESMTKVDPNRVIVSYTSNIDSSINLAYIKENGEWKVNLEDQASLTHFNLQILLTQANEEGYSKEFFVDYVISEVLNIDDSNILMPLYAQR